MRKQCFSKGHCKLEAPIAGLNGGILGNLDILDNKMGSLYFGLLLNCASCLSVSPLLLEQAMPDRRTILT